MESVLPKKDIVCPALPRCDGYGFDGDGADVKCEYFHPERDMAIPRKPLAGREYMHDLLVHQAALAALKEGHRADKLHGPIKSAHECYGIIAEELDEFFDEVKAKQFDQTKGRSELIQIAAACIRAVADICPRAER